ncbi:MAG: M23 family metallopeptidase [Chitinophagaceae bacterium]
MKWRVLLLTALVFFSLYARAQPPSFPRYYFRNPLGIPMQLAANFGELRPDHWHMGLDIRTDAKENQPVYAAADGYIAHIGIRPQSFGRFIIINHPNGLSTLYAHLNDFYPALEEYVTEQQYKEESWAVELDFKKDKFPLTKGTFIAYSGNTGGSQGPHLHFEIFDTRTEKRINPLLFDLPIEDKVPPTLVKLGVYDRSKTVYDQQPLLFSLKNTDSGYIIPKVPVMKTGLNKISFALQAYDRMSGSGSPDGIFSAQLYLDDEPQVSFVLDSFDYKETVYINAHIDYRYKINGGAYLQHLSVLPGEKGVAYRSQKGNGIIELSDTIPHLISVDVKDAYGNVSQLNFMIQYDDSLVKKAIPVYSRQPLAPNRVNQIEKPGFEMRMPEGCLYDTVPLLYFRNHSMAGYGVSDQHQVNDASYPVHEEFVVRIKPDKTIPEEWKDKIMILRSSKGNTIRKAKWEGEWLMATFSDFGTFQAIADLTPPSIDELGKGDTINLSAASRILFTPTDNFGIVKNFRVELDNQWLRFTNDKSRNWIYKFDERCPYGVHQLTATATDHAGNVTVKEWWFRREPYTPPPPKKKSVKGKKGKVKKNKK